MRTITDPFVVAPPAGSRVRTRLRVSPADAGVLGEAGAHLGMLAGQDLAARCRLGRQTVEGSEKHAGRADRKRALTAESSSRWAGTITRTTGDQWERALANSYDDRRGLRAAIQIIQVRLDAPVGGKAGKVRGYATRAERFAKQGRLQHLRARLAGVEETITTGQVQVVRGGRRHLNTRHHLNAAGITEDQWRDRWQSSRMLLTADGESGKRWGNETIRIHPDTGTVELRLPTPLAHLTNTPRRAPVYRLDATARFTHQADAWAAQAGADRAVRYDITHDPTRGRWYIDASWTTPTSPPPALEVLREHPTLAVDVNADHLACWVLAPDGNPVGPPHTIRTVLTGSRQQRDGRLRQAITTLLDLAAALGCASVTIENLDFAQARTTGRETMGRGRKGRRFRRTVAGIPTARFRTRLVGMATNRGLAVIAVDPAYTSKWGSQHWRKSLQQTFPDHQVTRHQAAAVVIGRRGQGHKARRRTGVPDSDQRIAVRKLPSRPDPNALTARTPRPRQGAPQRPRPHQQTGPPHRNRTGQPGRTEPNVRPGTGHPPAPI